MTTEKATKLHIGQGILKPDTRPVVIFVSENGEYWLCDADIDPESSDFRREGCGTDQPVRLSR